jgi:hypothetical protein
MVAPTLPYGARREYPDNITSLDIAKSISSALVKRMAAMVSANDLVPFSIISD